MRSLVVRAALACLLAGAIAAGAGCTRGAADKKEFPMVVMETSEGVIKLELWPDKAPVTVANFLRYVDEKHYDGTIFHRVMAKFMIQGGGFAPDMRQKPTHEPIRNEAANGLKNQRGTIAMARTDDVDSATAQFFINAVSNGFLDHSPASFGYAVFGQVVEGMDVVARIEHVPTGTVGGYENVPLKPVVIRSARRAQGGPGEISKGH